MRGASRVAERDIEVERVGPHIELYANANPRTTARCQKITGARWSRKKQCWTYPLDIGVCRALRGQFGERLDVGPELSSWSRAEVKKTRTMARIAADIDGSSIRLVSVPVLAPRIAEAMDNRGYQKVAPAYGHRAKSFWIFDQPGLGKTIMLLATVIESFGDTDSASLVFCPKTAVGVVWGPEIRQWLPDAHVFEVRGTRAQREKVLAAATAKIAKCRRLGTGHVFVVCNTEMARIEPWYDTRVVGDEVKDPDCKKPKFLTRQDTYVRNGVERKSGPVYPELLLAQWDLIAVDEAQDALIKSGRPTQVRSGMAELGRRCERRIALTGTPMRGKAPNLWGTLNWCRPDLYPNYWKWAQRYFNITSNGFSRFVIDPDDQWAPGGKKRLGEDLKLGGIRRTKNEVLSQLPPKLYAGTYLIPGDKNSPHAVWLSMEGKQAKQYAELEREGALSTDEGEIIAKGHLAEATRLKQSAGSVLDVRNGKVVPLVDAKKNISVKYEWLLEKLYELGIPDHEGESKIVVASQFSSLLTAFAAQLKRDGIDCYLLTGNTTDAQRIKMGREFQQSTGRNAVRVFLTNMKAGGKAITLDAADDLVLLDETFDPDLTEQTEDRVHRTSRIHNVTIYKLKCLDTVEEEVAWIVAARENVVQYLLDGARGVEAARQRYEYSLAA